MSDFHYFDNNATTAIAPEVFEAMVPFLTESYGNPSSAYSFGKKVRQAVETARAQVAALINADPSEIYFTSCGTESDNAAIWSALRSTKRKHLITSQVEHSAILHMGESLEHQGYGVTWLPVNPDGTLDLVGLEESIRPDTGVVSLMWANNETGVLFPIEKIAAICREKKVLFHTDAVQTPGKIAIDVKKVPVDFLAISGHKLHAPKGVGVLYVRKGVPFIPFQIGGGQERGKRAGTENVASIVGLGKAAERAQETLIEEQTRVRAMRDRFENGMLAKISKSRVNGNREERLPNTSNLCFVGADAQDLLGALDEQGICCSAGSACTTGSVEPSHVLSAMGVSENDAKCSLRFSFSHFTRESEIDHALEVIPAMVEKVRSKVAV
ncbi:MAG: cysteine desulfurase NifS [Verrucomicrobiota bacterium]